MGLTLDIKRKIGLKLIENRATYGGADAGYAMKYGIPASSYSQIKSGTYDKLLSEEQWINIAIMLNFDFKERNWKLVRTEVFQAIESDILFCKEHAKAMMFVDACEIGKSYTAEHLARTLTNCFYIDCSLSKTKTAFIRALSRAVGLGEKGSYNDMREKIMRYLRALESPIVILDEAGDLEGSAFLEIKALWNATDGFCGWYMMGADGLRSKINQGIQGEKVGFTEIFSRFSGKFQSIVPVDKIERLAFQKKLLSDVLKPNVDADTDLDKIIRKCLANDGKGELGGLRRAESLVILQRRERDRKPSPQKHAA